MSIWSVPDLRRVLSHSGQLHRAVPMLVYFGPEVLMPVLSALAAAVGAVLIVGKRILHAFRSTGRWIASLVRGDGRETSREDDAGEMETPPS